MGTTNFDTVQANVYAGGTPPDAEFPRLTATESATIGTGGTPLTLVKLYSQSLDVASVNANTSAEQTFTVTGLTTADKVVVSKPSLSAGLVLANARVSAADTLALTFGNLTASPINPAAETYTILAFRS